MRNIVRAGLLLLAPALLLAQIEPGTLTITASQQVNPQPDQAVFDVYVSAPVTKGLNDILAELPGTGITAADLYYVSTPSAGYFTWSFEVDVPLSNIQATVAALAAAQQTVNPLNQGGVTFYTDGLQVSPALLASQTCPMASLVSSAQAQAQTIANAAGLSLGPILSLNTSGTGALWFNPAFGFTLRAPFVVSGEASPNCSVAVTFRLLSPIGS